MFEKPLPVLDSIKQQALVTPMDWSDTTDSWKIHIGLRTIDLWHTFTDEQKIALASDADDTATSENYD